MKTLNNNSLINLKNLTEIQAFPIFVSKNYQKQIKKYFLSGDALLPSHHLLLKELQKH